MEEAKYDDGIGGGDDGERDGRCIGGGGVHVSDVDWWVTVPYISIGGILHGGDLPHLSAPTGSIFATNERTRRRMRRFPSTDFACHHRSQRIRPRRRSHSCHGPGTLEVLQAQGEAVTDRHQRVPL
jgi:hypothetical protein